MKKIVSVLLMLCSTSISTITQAENNQLICGGKEVLGGVEKVTLLDKGVSLDAKLDTGAAMASLSASDIKTFNRDNKVWVSFTMYSPATQTKITFEKPLLRYVRILKRKEEASNTQTGLSDKQFGVRPVVPFSVCISDQKKTIPVNLIDRTQFKYPMLLGSGTLKEFHVLVDVSQQYLTVPKCSNQ